METLARRYTEKGCQLGGVVAHVLDHFVERGVGKVVSIVGQEHLVALEERLDLLEALADVGVKAGVDQGNVPTVDLAGEMSDVLSPLGNDKVIGGQLAKAEEIILDGACPIAEAENEVSKPIVSVVLHDMPKDRPIADAKHRLGNLFRDLPHPHTQTAAEDHDFHFYRG